ncbi:MAG: hypothetical protein KGN79_12930 [Acidobacteriota bacterium]|nr:hypothetical protein [Acidobacteriota bacterium]
MSQEINRGNETEMATAEETLRLVARMPAPEGLEERVKARLNNAPLGGRLLTWPGADKRWSQTAFVRGAAAAMIVCLVGGGAWTVYAHVQHTREAARVVQAPLRQAAPGSFSNAGAIRSPRGTIVVHPMKPKDGKTVKDSAKSKSKTKDVQPVDGKLEPVKPQEPQ